MDLLALDLSGHLSFAQQLQILRLPEPVRRRLLYQVGKQVLKSSRQRLRQQKTVEGQSFEPRKGRGKQRMLRRMGRGMRARSTADEVTVSWGNAITAEIAYRHQEGIPEEFDAKKMRRIHGVPDYQAPATRLQAIALRKLDYRIRRAGVKGWNRPSLRWIQDNLSLGQAGVIIRAMRDELKHDFAPWLVDVPARPFLGANLDDQKFLVGVAVAEITRALESAKR